MDKQLITRIFMVGPPRSGSTLLQSLIGSHSQVCTLPETHYFMNMQDDHPGRNWLTTRLGIKGKSQLEKYKGFIEMVDPQHAMRWPKYPIFVRKYCSLFIQAFDRQAREQGKTAWLEKTNTHVLSINTIERFIPNCLFIHIVRDPADNIASLRDLDIQAPGKWGDTFANAENCTSLWLRDINASLKQVGKRNHKFVSYRQVVESTQDTLERICEFLCLPFEPEMIKNHHDVADKITPSDQNWRRGAMDPIQNRAGTKFQTIFTQEEQNWILKKIKEVDLTPLGVPL